MSHDKKMLVDIAHDLAAELGPDYAYSLVFSGVDCKGYDRQGRLRYHQDMDRVWYYNADGEVIRTFTWGGEPNDASVGTERS